MAATELGGGSIGAGVRGDVEQGYVQVLSGLVAPREVRPDSHFFDDLGANSLTMTHFCARVRKRPELPKVSIRDIYAAPTIAQLVARLAPAGDPEPAAEVVGGGSAPSVAGADDLSSAASALVSAGTTGGGSHRLHSEVPVQRGASAELRGPARRAPGSDEMRRRRHWLCGLTQLVVFVVYSHALTLATVRGYEWIEAGSTPWAVYLRAVLGGGGAFLGVCLVPVAAKWLLIGRWTTREVLLWSPEYVRFWIVKSLLHSSPVILFVGSPLYVIYLRLLGAKVGPGVTILSRTVPVCTDLITIGAGSVIRKECVYLGYRVESGIVRTGPVTVGSDAFVGEKTVLDIGSEVGDDAQLGHASALQQGDSVPDGARWHGSPPVPTDIDYLRVPAYDGLGGRRFRNGLGTLVATLAVYVPAGALGIDLVVSELGAFGRTLPVSSGPFAELAAAMGLALVLLALALTVGLGMMMLLPRLLGRLLRADTVYPLYGWQFTLHRTIQALTNRRLMTWLFGDSSFIVAYLRGLGYQMPDLEQTGSNFGTEVQHETPLHVTVGSGTMVADGLSIVNADYSATSFRISRVTLGAHSFLGNNIVYPSGARVGEDCLLATKVMVPLDGPVRHGVGLLGSPPFEIPRTVERDAGFEELRRGEGLEQRLRAKNTFNLRSMALMLGARWVDLIVISALGYLLLSTGRGLGHQLALAVFAPAAMACSVLWFVLVERTILRFGALAPRLCSIYDPYFWWHERLWKVPDHYLNLLNGTPAKPWVWRLLGVRIGRRVFDDGAYLTERTLTAIGDEACLNLGSKLQAHSQEDGTFKSDRISIGAGATLAVGAFVHYGTSVGEGALIETDSFLMKGEEVPVGGTWRGNPATSVAGSRPVAVPVIRTAGKRAARRATAERARPARTRASA